MYVFYFFNFKFTVEMRWCLEFTSKYSGKNSGKIAEIKLEKCWSLLKLGGEYLELYYTIPFTFEYVYNLPSGFLRILL